MPNAKLCLTLDDLKTVARVQGISPEDFFVALGDLYATDLISYPHVTEGRLPLIYAAPPRVESALEAIGLALGDQWVATNQNGVLPPVFTSRPMAHHGIIPTQSFDHGLELLSQNPQARVLYQAIAQAYLEALGDKVQRVSGWGQAIYDLVTPEMAEAVIQNASLKVFLKGGSRA